MVPSVVWLQRVFHLKSTFWWSSSLSWLPVLFGFHMFFTQINTLGRSLHFVWFPLLFGSLVLSAHSLGGSLHFHGFQFCLSKLWVPYFTFHGSLYCYVPVLFSFHIFFTQNQHFGLVSFTSYGSQCSLAPTCFPLKSTVWGVPFTFMVASVVWLPYLTENQFFGWFPSLVMVPIVVQLIGALC